MNDEYKYESVIRGHYNDDLDACNIRKRPTIDEETLDTSIISAYKEICVEFDDILRLDVDNVTHAILQLKAEYLLKFESDTTTSEIIG